MASLHRYLSLAAASVALCACNGNPTTSSSSGVTLPSSEPTSVSSKEDDGYLDVLFLGNSLMFFNDMPQMFEEMATVAGKKIRVESVTQGSATISLFADINTDMGMQAMIKIYEKEWDYIVIEPSRRASPWETTVYNAEIEAAEVIYDMAQEVGAEILIYAVWGNDTGNLDVYQQTGASTSIKTGNQPISRKAHTAFLHDFALDVSAVTGNAKIIEAGYAFENAIARDPSINLYYSDSKHPSLEGSYLAGLTVFGTIYQETNAYMSYDKGLSCAATLKAVADATTLDGLVPDLTDEEKDPSTDLPDLNVLCVGSNYMSDYSVAKMFLELVKDVEKRTVNMEWVLSGNYTNRDAADPNSTIGSKLRTSAASKVWDVVIFQLSRRCTASSSGIEAKEKEAIISIVDELFSGEDAPSIFVYTMQSGSNPSIFSDDGSNVYSKTSNKENYSAEVGTEYFKDTAEDWAEAVHGGTILYGSALIDYNAAYNKTATHAEMGYMKACCFYNAIFEKSIPSSCTYYYSIGETLGLAVREYAELYCLQA